MNDRVELAYKAILLCVQVNQPVAADQLITATCKLGFDSKTVRQAIQLGFERNTIALNKLMEVALAEQPVAAPEPTEEQLVDALRPLVEIARAYFGNSLDDEARRFWGRDLQYENTKDPKEIELYQGRGGKCLLTLNDCITAYGLVNHLLPKS